MNLYLYSIAVLRMYVQMRRSVKGQNAQNECHCHL